MNNRNRIIVFLIACLMPLAMVAQSTHWVPQSAAYENNMTLTGVIQINGVEQQSAALEVGAFCGTECRGSVRAVLFPPTGRYVVQLTIFGNNGDQIIFRLYNHDQGVEMNLQTADAVTFGYTGLGSLVNPYVLNFTEFYTISASAIPSAGGSVSGAGGYDSGSSCTLTATPNPGYTFIKWTKNGSAVSFLSPFNFSVTESGDYVAVFEETPGIVIGEPEKSGANYSLPSGSYAYSLSQQIYTSDEIGWSGTITGLSFFNAGEQTVRNYNIYMVHTDKTGFDSDRDWIAVTDSDLVFSGDATMRACWTTIVLDTPFVYNGTSNLAIVIDDNTGNEFHYGSSTPFMACRVFNIQGNQSISYFSSINNTNPFNPSGCSGTCRSVKNQIAIQMSSTYDISAVANPTAAGIIDGAGSYVEGSTCTLTASANTGYTFQNWMRDGQVVSTNTSYSFTVTGDDSYVANFNTPSYVISATANPSVGGTVSGEGTYIVGSTCTLTATANPGYAFMYWSWENTYGYEQRSYDAVYSFTVDGNRDLEAFFSPPFTITVSSNSSEGGSVTGGGVFDYGTTCTLIATPNPGYSFIKWTKNGSAVSYLSPFNYSVTESGDYVAVFEETPGIIIGAPEGAESSLPVSYGCHRSLSQQIYTSEEIGASGAITSISFFNIGSQPSRPYDIYLVHTDKTDFASNTDWITVSESDLVFSGNVTMTPACWTDIVFDTPFVYNGLSNLAVVIVDDGDLETMYGSTFSCRTFNGQGNQAIQRVFFGTDHPNPYYPSSGINTPQLFSVKNQIVLQIIPTIDITATPNPAEGGVVSGGGAYVSGTTCTLTATANTGYTFVNWTENGNVVSTNANYTFTVNSNRTLVAQFQLQSFSISASANPSDGGTVSGGGTYNYGSTCNLTATPATGYSFVRWTKNGSQVTTDASYTFTVTEDATFIAEFEENPVVPTGDLVAYYPLDGDVNDYSGYGNHGAIIGNVVPATDRKGNPNGAYRFPGEPFNYISVPDAEVLHLNSFTLSAWVYTDADNYGSGYLVDKGRDIDNGSYHLCVRNVGATTQYGGINDAGIDENPAVNQWHMITGTVEGNQASFYLDGVLMDVKTLSQPFTCTTTEPLTLGMHYYTGVPSNWAYDLLGVLDEVRIYNRAFSAQEVKNLYNSDNGCLPGIFSISEGTQVLFSQGNLQYQASTNTWRFAESQWDCIGEGNSNISEAYDGWIDLFGWGTSGYDHGAVCYQPWSTSTNSSDYYAYGSSSYNLYDQTSQADWGYNAIANGGNTEGQWRTLTRSEWDYVFNTRSTTSGIRYAKANVNNVNGIILLPDDWDANYYSLSNTNGGDYGSNTISASQWSTLEQHGAVFMPATDYRLGTSVYGVGSFGNYWSASYQNIDEACSMYFSSGDLRTYYSFNRDDGLSVRLVRSAQNDFYGINTTPNPAEGGAIEGAGVYEAGTSCTLVATPNEGYTFMYWTENGNQVSSNAEYSFVVTTNRDLVAHFALPFTISATANPAEGGTINGTGEYDYNTTCTLTAMANEGYTFMYWTENGNQISSNAEYSFAVTTDRDLVAHFSLPLAITATANPTEGGMVEGIGEYNYNTTCTLTAMPNEGYTFMYWTENGNQVSTIPEYSFTVTADRNLVAHFALPFSITATANPVEGGTITYGICTNFDDNTMQDWTTIDADGDGYTWDLFSSLGYNGQGHNGSADLVYSRSWMNGVGALNPDNFLVSPQMHLGGVISFYARAQDASYAAEHFGVAVSTTSNIDPDAFTTLQEWTITAKGSPEPAEFTRSGNRSQGNWYHYIVDLNDYVGQTGYVSIRHFNCSDMFMLDIDDIVITSLNENGNVLYDYGTICTVTAIPNDGYTFMYWTENGNQVSSNAEYSFTVTADRSLVAHFSLPLLITVEPNSTEGGAVTGAGEYNYGTTCTLTATADQGYSFVKWTKNGNVVSYVSPFSFTVTEDADYVAHFEEISGVMVGAPESTNYYLPSYSTYNYTLSQQIYTSEEIGGSNTINSIAFFNAGGQKTRNYDIYMVHTDKTVFDSNTDWITVSETDRVFSGNLTFPTGQWTSIVLDTPFAFDGTSNLAIIVDDNSGNWSGNPMACRVFNANGSQAIRVYSDGTNYDPYNPSSYGGTLHNVKNQVIFGMSHYTIAATSSDSGMGTVAGSGQYDSGATCTLTANASGDNFFTSWTENGVIVSTEPAYTFTVTRNRNLVANFSTNHWTPIVGNQYNMTVTGVISINGVEQTSALLEVGAFCGEECRASEFAQYFPVTQQYVVTLTVRSRTLTGETITFRLYDHLQGRELDELQCVNTVTFENDANIGSIGNWFQFAFNSQVEISATVNPDGAGAVTGTGAYTLGTSATLVAEANEGFAFRDWSLNGEVVSTESTYTFVVTGTTHLEANFDYVNAQDLVAGWNWWGTSVEVSGATGLEMIENSLGSNGISIKSQGQSTQNYYPETGYNYWFGSLQALDIAKGYKINVSEAAQAVMIGAMADPSLHPVTITTEWNWIGYPVGVAQNLTVALSGFTPSANDVFKGQGKTSVYYEDYGWFPDFTLQPGNSYMYKSNDAENKTLVYSIGRSTAVSGEPEHHWQPIGGNQYNMSVTGVIVIDGVEQQSTALEVGAFCGDECRASEFAQYFPVTRQYVVTMTIRSNSASGETITFRLYDHNTGMEPYGVSPNSITFETDAIVGSMNNWYQFAFLSSQTINTDLAQGWTWFAPTVQTSIEAIQTALGGAYVQILAKNGAPSGDIVPGEMYRIQTNAPCTLAVTGAPITTATITINRGENWFGYVGTEKTVTAAFEGFTPAEGDKVVSQNDGFAIYENGVWVGTLGTLQPGKGYVYVSKDAETKTLIL